MWVKVPVFVFLAWRVLLLSWRRGDNNKPDRLNLLNIPRALKVHQLLRRVQDHPNLMQPVVDYNAIPLGRADIVKDL